jgi:hypothetical protein
LVVGTSADNRFAFSKILLDVVGRGWDLQAKVNTSEWLKQWHKGITFFQKFRNLAVEGLRPKNNPGTKKEKRCAAGCYLLRWRWANNPLQALPSKYPIPAEIFLLLIPPAQ